MLSQATTENACVILAGNKNFIDEDEHGLLLLALRSFATTLCNTGVPSKPWLKKKEMNIELLCKPARISWNYSVKNDVGPRMKAAPTLKTSLKTDAIH